MLRRESRGRGRVFFSAYQSLRERWREMREEGERMRRERLDLEE
jgi:hypothetical protein